jgi:lipopolysaccharide export system protein LptC
MNKKEYTYKMNILLDEKDAAKEIMDTVKGKSGHEDKFKMARAYRNKNMRLIRELKTEYTVSNKKSKI